MTQAESSATENTERSAGPDAFDQKPVGHSQRPVIRGRMTWSMIRELRIVVPSVWCGPVYRVTGDWETLVESRQTLEWIHALAVGIVAGFLIGPAYEPFGLTAALKVTAFFVLVLITRTALDAFWAARHAVDLELVDRAESGYDEWRTDRRRQRSWPLVVSSALLLSGTGGWMLWAMTQSESSMNPWLFVPIALLLIGTSIRSVLEKLRHG